jgi:transcriptional regulatory protein LevR
VEVLVVFHGLSTATSMAQVVNVLLGENIVTGFDAPLKEQPKDVYGRIVKYLKVKTGVKEVLLLVDMGSLTAFAKDMERDLGISVKCISMASTAHVLEAARAASMNYPLAKVWQQAVRISELQRGEQQLLLTKDEELLFILTICTTGEGTARFLRDYLYDRLDLTNRQCEIIELQCGDEQELKHKLKTTEARGKIIASVSGLKITLPYRNFRLVDVLEGGAVAELQQLVNREATYLGIKNEFFGSLKTLCNTGAFYDVKHIIEEIIRSLSVEVDDEVIIGAICHTACMLDRLIRGETVSVFKGIDKMMQKYAVQLSLVRKKMDELGMLYGVSVPFDEVCYVTAFIMRENLIGL